MKCNREILKLYAVTDRAWSDKKTLICQIEEALSGGVTCVQLREKNLSDEKFLEKALEVKKICQGYNVPFIVNDNVKVACECNADGIHVGQGDMVACKVREKIGSGMILGVSVQTVEEAIKAWNDGADYLGVGAVFSTSTKLDAVNVSSKTLETICKAVPIPVVAIGGITKENIYELKGTGVDGVALVSAIFAKDDITTECRKLLEISEKCFYM